MHAAVASLHAVAADLTERAEAVDAELAALAERKADAHERAAAPLERRRDRIARLVEDVERSLRRAAAADFDDGSAALRVGEEAARARDERDAIARDAESSRRNDTVKHEAQSAPSFVRRGRPPVARGFAFSPPASPPRRRATSSDARVSTERVKSSADVNPPWDGRTALDTSRDDEARARRDRSRSKSPARETASQFDVSAAQKVSAGQVPWYAGAIPPRTTFPPPPPAQRAERAERERKREPDPDVRAPAPAPAPDFAAALWPDFSAYGYGGGAAGMRPGDASSRVEALRGGYQTALLEMQRARAAEREAAAAAAEAAARELELQRAQLAAIASRLAKAAGVPSAPRAWGGSISRAADAAAFAAEAERSEAAPGPAFAAAAAAAERERRNRATRRAREHDTRVEEEAETYRLRASSLGASSGSLASAMADLAEVARVTRERMEGLEVDATKKETEGSAREAVATAARHAAAAAAASAAGGSPAVVATALAEMAAALRRAERAAAGVDASAARGEARAARAESMLERTADALEDEARGSDAEFGRILDELRVARDRVESDDDERGASESGTLHAPNRAFDEDAFILSEILRKADAEARSDAEAAAAAAAIRGSLEARGETFETFSPRVSATSPRRPARRRQLGDRVPPDPRRPSSLEFKGPARFGANLFSRDEDETPAQERETYEVIGPASFSVNRFGTLVAAGPK